VSEDEVKRLIRERDGYKCLDCGMTQAEHAERHGRGLEVHRTTPGSEYALDDTCVTLCMGCHDKRHVLLAVPGFQLRLPLEVVQTLRMLAAQLHLTTAGDAVVYLMERFGKQELVRLYEEGIRKTKKDH
jgi:hypothetical protein